MRHLGQDRQVTTEQATLQKRILRLLFMRQGGQVEGQFANRCGQKMNDPRWREAVKSLVAWGFVAQEPTGYGNTTSVSLTDEGKLWGEEIACSTNAEILATAQEQ